MGCRTRFAQLCLSVALLSIAGTARADDFGDFFKKTARDALRNQVAPDRPGPNPRGGPGPAPGRGQIPGQFPGEMPGRPVAVEERGGGAPLTPPRTAGEPFTVKTADGWTLVAHRFRPTVAPRAGAAPIILCHGLTYNAMFWELDPSCSPAAYFAGMGYDVWTVDLRGCGQSTKWVWKIEEAPALLFSQALSRMSKGKIPPQGYASIDPRFARWTLDDHITYDVPALVSLVRKQTGAAEVTWLGHSMGGIVALGHLSRYKNPGIGRLVTVGSQVTMPQGQIVIQFVREMIVTRQGQLTGQLRGEQLAVESKTSVDNMFFNEANAMPKVFEALSTWAKDVPAMGLLQQYMALGQTGELVDVKKTFNFSKSLTNITVPVLVSCGADDQFAPPSVQQYLYDNVGSADKTLVIFGRQSGFSVDAGHDDSLVGLNSRREVYPWLERWIAGGRDLPGPTTAGRTARPGVIAR